MAYITINRSHFRHNVGVVRGHLKAINTRKHIELAAVLKDNAYGHGLDEMSDLAVECGIDSVFVKNYDEALRIAHKFKHTTFFYGGFCDGFKGFSRILDSKASLDLKARCDNSINIYPTLHSLDDLADVSDLDGVGVELKINTGMNRNGLEMSEIESCVDKILKRGLRLVGVFSHNGYGDVDSKEFENQRKRFSEVKQQILYLAQKRGFDIPRFHSLNSSSALRSQTCDDDLVRIGIALYGYLGNEIFIESRNVLKPVLKLYANKVATRTLESGENIGYGGITRLSQKGVVSSYDIGYGDGLYRLNGSKRVFLPVQDYESMIEILPKTSMDCFSCFSQKDKLCVMDDANYIAKVFDTIPYEVLTRLSPFIKRVIVES